MPNKPTAPPGGGRPPKGKELGKKTQLNFRISLEDKAELILASVKKFETLDQYVISPAVKKAREDNLKS
ncbi:hypothetical protein KAR91_66815 [Candidatus Pacearchaeota archaeon]|nr:hypothetical protein [Candidatus Pacearchaeota archaeon]